MLHASDFLAVKLTGAGPIAIDAMRARQPMPKAIRDAMDEICLETRKQGSRLWVDAEQQILQHGLDEWVIELMRKHNQDGKALVYNTIQGYLKGAPANVERHLTLASQEGWAVGLKLCRGAYIEHEERSLIHDTKEDTDRCYDSITEMLISQRMPEGHGNLQFPVCALFLATHNAESAEKAIAAYRRRNLAGLPNIALECGQLQGMADELSCALLDSYDNAAQNASGKAAPSAGVFKYLTWGSVTECMGYLHRRAIENRGAVERTQHMATALRQELRRRILG
ncbi:FAD-linked oxidoreductase [Thozetella sp. PMI_491]|nr:FAD-linked oxidoreductase [Thozetella sp. PMI_491]